MTALIIFIYSTLFYGVDLAFKPKGPGGLNWPNLIMIFVVAITIIKFFNRIKIQRLEFAVLLLFLFVCFANVLVAEDKYGYMINLIAISRGIILALLMQIVVSTPDRVNQVLKAIIGVGLLGAHLAVVQELIFLASGKGSMGYESTNIFWAMIGSLQFLRVSTYLADPNVFGLYIALAIIVFWTKGSLILEKWGSGWRMIYISTLLLLALALTFSRSAIITVLFYLVILFCRVFLKLRIKLWIFIFGLCSLGLGFIIFDSRGLIGETSAISRLELVFDGLKTTIEYPLFGVGLGNFGNHTFHHQAAHNLFLELSGEMGVIGSVVFIILILLCFRNSYRDWPLFSLVLCTMMFSVFLSTLTNVFFWLSIALALSPGAYKQNKLIRLNRNQKEMSMVDGRDIQPTGT